MNSDNCWIPTRMVLGGVVVASVFCAGQAHAQNPRVVFATSVTGTAELGSWPEAGSAVGAAAGDAICQNLAQAAGLDNPANFVAWLSTTTDDAYCRLHGLTGTKASNCGQAQLPVSAGPWVRPDGLPFSETIDRLMFPERLVYYPIGLDELGSPAIGPVYSATDRHGTVVIAPTTCTDWTDSSALAVGRGESNYGSVGWTLAGTVRCDGASRLLCFETGAGPPIDPPSAIGAMAFVTSVVGNGNLGSWGDAGGEVGIAAGDAICQARAAAEGFDEPSSFKAWLSDSTTDAKNRFTYDGPLARPDGVQVAATVSDLANSNLIASLNVTDLGAYLSNIAVWTGTDGTGILTGNSCSDWTTSADISDARSGAAYATGNRWTTAFTLTCDWSTAPLYCISDSQAIFINGFESGDTASWSSVVP